MKRASQETGAAACSEPGMKAEYTVESLVEAVKHGILEGEAEETMRLLNWGIDNGFDPSVLIDRALVGGMGIVGRDFKNGEFYVPDVLMSARALKAALFTMKKRGALVSDATETPKKGRILVGTVAGDLHDIGKNIASLMFEIEGFEVIDLGIDVVPEVFVAAVKKHRPDVLGLSALLTTTVTEMKNVIDALVRAKVRDTVSVYVSGAPVTQELADLFGADHYSPDARDSVCYALEIMKQKAALVS